MGKLETGRLGHIYAQFSKHPLNPSCMLGTFLGLGAVGRNKVASHP